MLPFRPGHLGFEDAKYVVPIYLVAETPWPKGFTIGGNDQTRGCLPAKCRSEQGLRFSFGTFT
jgi:hypothetical protein